MSSQKFITIGGKKIFLTKEGLPNLRLLKKDQRAAVKGLVEKATKAKKEVELKQLEEVLKKLLS